MIRIFRFASAALGKGFAVRLWHTADILAARSVMSAFGGQSGHRDFGASCPLLTQSGHRAPNLL
jgi:hypothetical protein